MRCRIWPGYRPTRLAKWVGRAEVGCRRVGKRDSEIGQEIEERSSGILPSPAASLGLLHTRPVGGASGGLAQNALRRARQKGETPVSEFVTFCRRGCAGALCRALDVSWLDA